MVGELNAYIDEAGDEGFQFRDPAIGGPGSSQWFVLAAVVVSQDQDQQVAAAINEIRRRLEWLDVDKPLRWRKLEHQKKKMVVQELRKKAFTAFAVGIHKQETDVRNAFDAQTQGATKPRVRDALYFYGAQSLAQMVVQFSNGIQARVKLVFEHRSRLTAAAMEKALAHVIGRSLIREITVQRKQSCKMLQVADACAGAVFNALEPDRYGNTEDWYLRNLKARFHTVNNKIWQGGVRLLPESVVWQKQLNRPARFITQI